MPRSPYLHPQSPEVLTPVPWPSQAIASASDEEESPSRSPLVDKPFTPWADAKAVKSLGWGAALVDDHPLVSPYARRRYELLREKRSRKAAEGLTPAEKKLLSRRREELDLVEQEKTYDNEEAYDREFYATKIQAHARGMLVRRRKDVWEDGHFSRGGEHGPIQRVRQAGGAVIGAATLPLRIVLRPVGRIFRRRPR